MSCVVVLLRFVTGRWAPWWRSTDTWVRGWGWISAKKAFHSHGTSTGSCQPVAVCLLIYTSSLRRLLFILLFCFGIISHSHTHINTESSYSRSDVTVERGGFPPGPDTKRGSRRQQCTSPPGGGVNTLQRWLTRGDSHSSCWFIRNI